MKDAVLLKHAAMSHPYARNTKDKLTQIPWKTYISLDNNNICPNNNLEKSKSGQELTTCKSNNSRCFKGYLVEAYTPQIGEYKF